VSQRLARGLLNFIIAVVVQDCSVGVVVVVMVIVGDMGGVANADGAGDAGVSAVLMDLGA
jgi:uncharacterized ion transporter superfamily protein YfcC